MFSSFSKIQTIITFTASAITDINVQRDDSAFFQSKTKLQHVMLLLLPLSAAAQEQIKLI
jgi:hypothetical protein